MPLGAHPKCVAFDVDGCLLDSDAVHHNALQQALHEVAGFMLTHDELRGFRGLPTREKLSRLVLADRLGTRDAGKVLERKQELTVPGIRALPHDPSKKELLATLRRAGYRLCAVSNAVQPTVTAMLENVGFTGFEFALSNEHAAPKPSPALYLLAAERFGCDPSRVVVVEDGDYGIVAAVRAGCQVVAVRSPAEVGPALLERIVLASVRSQIGVAA